jgi:hypothetical protein
MIPEHTSVSTPSSPYIILESKNDIYHKKDTIDYMVPLLPSKEQEQHLEYNYPTTNTDFRRFFFEKKKVIVPNDSTTSFYSLQSDIDTKIPEDESPRLPIITNIYIGSLTVVGLLILYRMLIK